MTDPYSTKEYKASIKRRTLFEWTWEDIDEHGDIQDNDFANKLSDLRARHSSGKFGLVRDVGSEMEGLQDRQWAYLDEFGRLPLEFDGGAKVPARFHKETM